MIRTLWMVLVLGLAGFLGWAGRGWTTSASPASTAQAQTCRVARGRMEQNIKSTVGYIKPAPNALVRVGFPAPKDLSRAIDQLHVQEGDRVSPGAVLGQLNHEDLKAAHDQLTAELHVTESRHETVQVQGPLDIRMAEAVLAASKAQRDHAQQMHKRKSGLHKENIVTAQDVEVCQQDLLVAQAKYEQAEVALQQVRSKFRTDSDTLKKQIKQTNAALRSLDVQMSWCTLRSPLAVPAQVFAVHQRQGELTLGQPQAPVLTLLDTSQLQAHLYVAEADFGRVRLDQPVTLRATSYPDQVLRGKIIRILPQPIMQDNVIYYLAVVEVAADQRSLLRVDMSVTAHIKAGVKDNALWLPLAALHSRPDGWYVMQPSPVGPVETAVQIGWQDQGRVEIREGLAEGDDVLLQP